MLSNRRELTPMSRTVERLAFAPLGECRSDYEQVTVKQKARSSPISISIVPDAIVAQETTAFARSDGQLP